MNTIRKEYAQSVVSNPSNGIVYDRGKNVNNNFYRMESEADAETEMVCDAMWDVCDEDTCKKIVQKVGAKQTKYFVDHLADVIAEMEKAFERYSVVFNEPELLDLKNDIESMKKIRDNFVKALEEMGTDSKKENTRTGDGGVKSSTKDAEEKIIDLSNDTRLKKQVEGVYGADRYKIIMNYILDELGGRPVTFGNDIFDVYLNVGLTRNDKTYHIYDITEKIRDSAHLIDVGRLTKSIAQKNAVSNDSIPNPTKKSTTISPPALPLTPNTWSSPRSRKRTGRDCRKWCSRRR